MNEMVDITLEEYNQLRADSDELRIVRNAIAILVSQVIVPEEA